MNSLCIMNEFGISLIFDVNINVIALRVAVYQAYVDSRQSASDYCYTGFISSGVLPKTYHNP